MNHIIDILSILKQKGIVVTADDSGTNLRLKGPVKTLEPAEIDLLKLNKNDILKLLAHSRYAEIPKLADQSDYQVSSSQRRLWILSQFAGGNEAYNMPGAYVFEGELDEQALESSFLHLLERHEVLRTVFRQNTDGELRQVVLEPAATGFGLERHDYRDHENAGLLIKDNVAAFYKAPFNLSQGPLLRAVLYRAADNRWVFSYVMHHIISDGWSMDILIRELLQMYNEITGGWPEALPDLRIQYKDYAAWQQQQLTGPNLQRHRGYWLEQLSGELPVLTLPFSLPRPQLKTYNGSTLYRHLDVALTAKLKQFSQQEGGTLFMGLLAVVNVLLYRYTGLTDQILGTPMAGRDHADLEHQIGFYVNTLALRTCLSGEWSYRRLLAEVKAQTLDAYEHQVYPFDELLEELQLRRDLSRNPLFDVSISLQNAGMNEGRRMLDKFEVKIYQHDEVMISKFDLAFNFIEISDELQIAIEYNNDLYERRYMDQLASHLIQLTGKMADAPDEAINTIDYLLPAEKEQLIDAFNNTSVSYPADKTLTALFMEQAVLNPQATAVVYGQRQLTYAELDQSSNGLSTYLRQYHGLSAGAIVGVQLERSEQLVIALLSVLKCGCTYLPLDPAYPEERLSYMLSDSGCRLVIDEALLSAYTEVSSTITPQEPIKVNPTDVAYVIYTSGSTGKPKGVMVEHGGLVNRLEWMWKELEFSNSDIIFQKTTFTFDVSVWEFFLPLCWGARMVMCEREVISSPVRILELIRDQRITTLHFVPGMLNAFMEALFDDQDALDVLKHLRCVVTSGEALTLQMTKHWYSKLSVPIYNLYGPTEASIDVTWYKTSPEDTHIPIGRPISNTQVYILNEAGGLQPVGIPGELYLGGAGIARGYLNNEALTEARFIPNPYCEGERLYRTGDLGRWLEDGNIEFLGRIDDQLKIRGYRIEPGEIAHELEQHPDISSAVVTGHTGSTGDKELVAYITGEVVPEGSSLNSWLAERVPSYMLPAHYVHLDKLPLTASGKIDKRSLPAPMGLSLPTGTVYQAPANETEAQLVKIWEEVLGRDRIGVNDNFFDLGGDSFKAIRLSSKLEKKISILDIYKNPTVKLLAAYTQEKDENELLEKITGSSTDKVSVIVMPYGAGEPVNYQKVASELALLNPDCGFYCIKVQRHELQLDATIQKEREMQQTIENLKPQVDQFIDQLIDEIRARIKTPIILYSKCVGAGGRYGAGP